MIYKIYNKREIWNKFFIRKYVIQFWISVLFVTKTWTNYFFCRALSTNKTIFGTQNINEMN